MVGSAFNPFDFITRPRKFFLCCLAFIVIAGNASKAQNWIYLENEQRNGKVSEITPDKIISLLSDKKELDLLKAFAIKGSKPLSFGEGWG